MNASVERNWQIQPLPPSYVLRHNSLSYTPKNWLLYICLFLFVIVQPAWWSIICFRSLSTSLPFPPYPQCPGIVFLNKTLWHKLCLRLFFSRDCELEKLGTRRSSVGMPIIGKQFSMSLLQKTLPYWVKEKGFCLLPASMKLSVRLICCLAIRI